MISRMPKKAAAGEKSTKAVETASIRVERDLGNLDGTSAEVTVPDPKHLQTLHVCVRPPDGIWRGEEFNFSLKFPDAYPHEPPKCFYLGPTRIWHPNIEGGAEKTEWDVYLNILRKDWRPVLGVREIVFGLELMFFDPNIDDPQSTALMRLELNNPQTELIVTVEERQEFFKALRHRVAAAVKLRKLEKLKQDAASCGCSGDIPPYTPTLNFKQFNPTIGVPDSSGAMKTVPLIRDDWRSTVKQLHSCGVYSVDLFTPEAIAALQREFERVNEWSRVTGVPLRRPNSMNNYGFVLADHGYIEWLEGLVKNVFCDMAMEFNSTNARHMWDTTAAEARADGDEERAAKATQQLAESDVTFPSIHTFTIRYRLGEDTHLATHVDNSDFTYNLCLEGDFDGATLYFKDQSCSKDLLRFTHKVGTAVFHRGHIPHGAEQLIRGFRTNLVVWCKTSEGGYSGQPPHPNTTSE